MKVLLSAVLKKARPRDVHVGVSITDLKTAKATKIPLPLLLLLHRHNVNNFDSIFSVHSNFH